MPIAQLYIIEGRTDEQKETLIREVSEAMSHSLDAPLERLGARLAPVRLLLRGDGRIVRRLLRLAARKPARDGDEQQHQQSVI